MWADAQRDGHPAEYRWRPLLNAANFGWCPLLEYPAVTLPWHETHWNQLGCPKLPDRPQPLVGRCSPYCGDIWRRHCCLTSFFPIVNMCLICPHLLCRAAITRWLYRVECPQYSTRLKALSCLCVCVSGHVQQVVKVICHEAHCRHRGMVGCYSTGASNVSSHEGTLAPPGK